jgi:protein-S-isoprenylcysteine O-methyltransferase Ste14
MHAVIIVIGTGWAIFWIYWLVASFTAKSSRGRWGGGWGGFAWTRVGLLVLVVFLIQKNLNGRGSAAGQITHNPVLEGIGLVVWLAGLGIAVWARLYIGRNWGMPMTRREHPDLVTTGPYRYVRHPIYSGIILAMVGTALATVLVGLVVVAVLVVVFSFAATREERFLTGEFPDSYPAYKASTKMLIPFVL